MTRFYSLIRSLAFLTFSFLPGSRSGVEGRPVRRVAGEVRGHTGVRIQLVKMPLIHRLYVKM
ncbi:hypothetical protein K469DRAFT_701165 [Zopfia rhizophila CBS 207.26]|uniref:Uncharacterized protein n=1 Tax=Zopfia rhizophila CBS 207.26 TaxID=1314779 RepID=A0A6A6EDF4_9PEZI|nr:hypothetical protein K469DRAFT_701165 [Zopfia rhizophila CBS 207.26]